MIPLVSKVNTKSIYVIHFKTFVYVSLIIPIIYIITVAALVMFAKLGKNKKKTRICPIYVLSHIYLQIHAKIIAF